MHTRDYKATQTKIMVHYNKYANQNRKIRYTKAQQNICTWVCVWKTFFKNMYPKMNQKTYKK